jgi:membrane protein DedA with SNARE-associated domain/rhodanese-related sulfurtransferase
MSAYLATLFEHFGPLIVFLVVFIDQLGIPVPAMPVLIVAGSSFGASRPQLALLFALAVLACLGADFLWYLIGRTYGMRVLKTLCRISLEPDSCVSQTQGRFERWGVGSLVIAKFVPGLAIIAPPLAGAMRVGWLRFGLLSLTGSALWVSVGLGAGFAFAAQIERIFAHLARVGLLAASGTAALLGAYVFIKWRERRRFLEALRMARITVDELYQLIETGKQPIILDVRTQTARSLEPRWIPNAIHAPLPELARALKDLSREQEIIVYCNCPNEVSAALVARQLIAQGFTKVRPLHGGLDAWVAAGYAVHSHTSAGVGAADRSPDAPDPDALPLDSGGARGVEVTPQTGRHFGPEGDTVAR